jgi:hypothetical protein
MCNSRERESKNKVVFGAIKKVKEVNSSDKNRDEFDPVNAAGWMGCRSEQA